MWKSPFFCLLITTTARSCLNIVYNAQSPLLPQEQVHLDFLNMSLNSVSRSVVKKVLAVETPEVDYVSYLYATLKLIRNIGRWGTRAPKHWVYDT